MTNDVSAHAVVLGATEVMERPVPEANVGRQVAPLPELLPAQAVQDEEHDLRGPVHRVGHPRRQSLPP